jgi:multiple sugar transport system substrate-binding protein
MTARMRAVWRVAGLASLALALMSSAAQAQTVINFLTAEEPETFAAVIEAFEAEHPEFTVEHTSVPFENMNQQIEARIGGQDPGIDVYLVDTPRVPAYVSRGYLLELEDMRPQVEAVTNETSRNVLSQDGKLYALPLWTSTQLMFYNKDLLDAAGIPHPSSEEAERLTVEEVTELARKAKAGGAEWGFVPEQIDRYYQLQAFFESAGAGPGLTGEGNLTPDLTSDKWIQTAEWYRSLFEEGISPRGIAVDQMSSVFTSGDAAFYIGGPWQFRPFTEAGVKFGVAPVPAFEGGTPAVPTDSWGVGISPYAGDPEGARMFAEYITINAEGSGIISRGHPIPPVNQEAYEPYIEEIEQLYPEIGADARKIMTYELANHSVSRPRTVGYVAFEEVMNRAFSDIRNGAEVQPVLEQAQQQLERTLARIQ